MSAELPPVADVETLARNPPGWCIIRSDDAGVIQEFRWEVRSFTHAETGMLHSHAQTWGAEPHAAAAPPIRFYPLRVANKEPDPRWFENVAADLEVDEQAPEVVVTWRGDLRELTEEIRDETRARIWDDSDRRLTPYDYAGIRESEFGLAVDFTISDYRAAVVAAAQTADDDIEAAEDMAQLGRAESAYEAAVDALLAPERNPYRRPEAGPQKNSDCRI